VLLFLSSLVSDTTSQRYLPADTRSTYRVASFIVSSALFYLNGNPAMQVSGFTYVTAALVGLVTMTVFVILYLITQMPLPILCTGLYTGAILSAALLTLLGQGPDKVSMCAALLPVPPHLVQTLAHARSITQLSAFR